MDANEVKSNKIFVWNASRRRAMFSCTILCIESEVDEMDSIIKEFYKVTDLTEIPSCEQTSLVDLAMDNVEDACIRI